MSKKSIKRLPLVGKTLMGAAVGVSLIMTALTGCQKTDQNGDALSKQVDALRMRVDTQARQLDLANQALLQHEMVLSRFEYTEFDPSAVRYFSLNNGVVSLIGQLVQVNPLADGKGSAVTLRLVNNGSVTVYNPGFMAQWGDAMPSGDKITAEDRQQWQKALYTSEFRGQMQLAPNDWTEITLSLNDVAPQQLHYMKLSMLMDQVQFDGGLMVAPARPSQTTVPAAAPAHP